MRTEPLGKQPTQAVLAAALGVQRMAGGHPPAVLEESFRGELETQPSH